MKFAIIIKILDFIHDILCPIFRDDKPKDENKEK
jgi:hypothetical protein